MLADPAIVISFFLGAILSTLSIVFWKRIKTSLGNSTAQVDPALESMKRSFDHLPGFASIIDSQMRYCYVSKKLGQQLNVETSTLVGQEVGLRGRNEEFVKRIHEFANSALLEDKFMTRLDFGMGLRVYDVQMNKQSLPGYIVTYSTDVTELIRLEQQVQQDQQLLNSTARLVSLGEIAGGLASEFINRLKPISKSAEQLKHIVDSEDLQDPKTKADLSTGINKILSSAENLSKLSKALK